ncbi:unnamed protein product [Chrysoparadoxa australica]
MSWVASLTLFLPLCPLACSWVLPKPLPLLQPPQSHAEQQRACGFRTRRDNHLTLFSTKDYEFEDGLNYSVEDDLAWLEKKITEVKQGRPPLAEGLTEHVASLSKPLGITIEEAPDDSGLVYVIAANEKAQLAGLQAGDVVTGVSAVFGDLIWDVRGKSLQQIRSLVRSRDEELTQIRVERGHVPLEERCDTDPETEGCGVFEGLVEETTGDDLEEETRLIYFNDPEAAAGETT